MLERGFCLPIIGRRGWLGKVEGVNWYDATSRLCFFVIGQRRKTGQQTVNKNSTPAIDNMATCKRADEHQS